MNDPCLTSPTRHPRTDTLALVLAGGTGTRMCGLTDWRAKPAVPFGGLYRTIDFTLSNCVNSGVRRIALLTQYKSQSLIRHVQRGWDFLRPELGDMLEIWPAQQRQGERWYAGTADAVHQNQDLIEALDPRYVLVLAGDHVYSMDYARMLEEHIANGADMTVGCVEVPVTEGHAYGIVELDAQQRMRSFIEKPDRPQPTRGKSGMTLASMGIYAFSRKYLFACLDADARNSSSAHDFGYSILPQSVTKARVFGHIFRDRSGAPGYWRDVGTVDRYWAAHMDLLTDPPKLNLCDQEWPLRTNHPPCAPVQISGSVRTSSSIFGPGCRISGDVAHSVLAADCRVGARARIESSVLLRNVQVGEGCILERVIVDSNCVIPDNTVIGGSLLDGESCHYVSPLGLVLVSAESLAQQTSRATKRKVA